MQYCNAWPTLDKLSMYRSWVGYDKRGSELIQVVLQLSISFCITEWMEIQGCPIRVLIWLTVAPSGACRNCLRQLYFTLKGQGIGFSFQLAITAPLSSIMVPGCSLKHYYGCNSWHDICQSQRQQPKKRMGGVGSGDAFRIGNNNRGLLQSEKYPFSCKTAISATFHFRIGGQPKLKPLLDTM